MSGRTTTSRAALPRAAALPVVLLVLLLATSGCAEDPTDRVSADATADTTASIGPASPSASAGGPSVSIEPESEPEPSPKKPKAVRGGGYASALPGSDAAELRKNVDTGPVFALEEDGPDIEEIERLVKAVERIAKQQQAAGQPTATGGSVAAAVGTFSYRYFDDGTVQPDPAWVSANIRTEEVPILGTVTGHQAMLPQLRGALREVAARGLADKIHADEFGGSYVPRFIGRDIDQGLSLHTWGIAVDLNVPGNQRGVAGEIDRDVVTIFKKWGFAWGGDWNYTDPIHFELASIVRSSG